MSIKELASERALVFFHLPKTGGTTLHHHFSVHFEPEEICPERHSNLNAYSVDELRQWRFFSGHFNADEVKRIPRSVFLVTVFRDPIERLLSLYYFWKRHKYEYIEQKHMEALKITKDGTLIDFLRSDHPHILRERVNGMTRQMAGAISMMADGYALMKDGDQMAFLSEAQLFNRALETLLSFDVIGDIAQLKDVYRRVAGVFGMAPLTEVARLNTRESENQMMDPYTPETITPEIWSLLEENTRLDRILYQLARDHWRRGFLKA